MFHGDRLKYARERIRMTVPELAATVGVSRAYLYQMESGDVTAPSAEVLYKLCVAVGTNMGYLLGMADEDIDLTSDAMMRTIGENVKLKRALRAIKVILKGENDAE